MAGMLLITHQAEPAAPVAAQDTSTIPGETWYNQQCAVCHGVRGTGELGPPLNVPPPPNVRNLPEDEQAAMFRNLVRNGIPGKMPGYLPSQVSDDQADQIRAYLKTLQDIPPGNSIYDAMIEVTPEQPAEREFFPETFHSVGEPFLSFWRENGGVRVFGYPITEEYLGVSPENGQVYRMQLFERARFELHEDRPEGEQVLLSLLGRESFDLHNYFGRRIHELGVGTRPIPRHTLNVHALNNALNTLRTDDSLHTRVKAISQHVQAEAGVTNLVTVVDKYLGGSDRMTRAIEQLRVVQQRPPELPPARCT
jgi:cytochrome c553